MQNVKLQSPSVNIFPINLFQIHDVLYIPLNVKLNEESVSGSINGNKLLLDLFFCMPS